MKGIYKCRICGKYVEDKMHCGQKALQLLTGQERLLLSKLLSYILRHNPGSIGIKLTSDGWANICQLAEGIKYRWPNRLLYQWVREEHIKAIAMLDPKGRFEVRNGLIRARYGHSRELAVNISYPIDTSSTVLYHGTTAERLKSILTHGLKPMKRKYVHLTRDPVDAYQTARRHRGRPVVLEINCEKLRKHNINIYIASPKIRLVEYVPPDCIMVKSA